MATINGARAFRREGIGRLEPGYRADLLLLNAKRLVTPYLWPGHDPYAAVLQKAEPDHLDMVISRGRVLLDGGRMVTVDEARVTRKLQSLYEIIWKKQDRQRQALVRELEPFFYRFFQPWQELPTPTRW
jgi:5-methylthioadenosine/S-adenosylhomocysteine deaminase